MKNKIYKAILATALAVAFVAPVATIPVYAGGADWYWEDEDPFITALWGKYSQFDGKLVYRVTGVKDVDFYTENIEEIKSYGFKISGEYANERGETYYKFRYVGNENMTVPLADTVTEEPIVKPDDPKHEITEEPIIGDYVVSDISYETTVEDYTVSSYDYTVTDPEEEVISSFDALKVAMAKADFYSEDNETFTTKMVDAKEVVWEEVWKTGEEPETPEKPDTVYINVPDTDIRIPWYEELLHNPADSLSGSTEGKETIWEWEGEPQVNFSPNCKKVCYQVDLSKDFTFYTENVDWICECGFAIIGETINKNGNVIYSFGYTK